MNKFIAGSFITAVFLSGCVKEPEVIPTGPIYKHGVTDPKDFISPYIFTPYNKDAYKKFYANVGKAKFESIQPLREKAALIAIKNSKCDRIEESEVLTTQSSKSLLKLRVVCGNTTTFETDENRLSEITVEDGYLSSLQQLAWDEGEAAVECQNLIKASAKYPGDADIDWFTGSNIRTAPYSAVVTVSFSLTLRNGFGMDVPHEARCLFQPGNPEGILDYLAPV